jgi:hypothetical protein
LPATPPPDFRRELRAAVGLEAGSLRLTKLRIVRDIHYLPKVPGLPWKLTLGPTQIAVLGDNQPYAIDSRHYGPIALESLLGVVKTATVEPRLPQQDPP